ncbi:MAG: tetratricopeptide repeat protein [Rhodanobacter sp.]
MAQRGFWREIRRRHVYRVAAAYAIVGWLLIQVATQVLPVFHLPDWIDQAVVLLILLGFPIALVLAWAFDATPRGIVRTDGTIGTDSMAPSPARHAGVAVGLIGVLVAAIAGLGWWHFQHDARQPMQGVAAASTSTVRANPPTAGPSASASLAPTLPAKSIAVLPFVNMSGDPKNDYFSDGITEEILDALAQLPHLKVAARTSAFAFKGKAEDLRKVGDVLDVATVLEGSVQKSGDEVRITAQLIDTRSGYHLWSEKYDRKLTSIFAVEDEISQAIADKLKVQLAGGSGQSLVPQKTGDPRAHDAYLRGLTLLAARSVGEAVDAFRQAVAIDPDYAQAWASLAEAHALLPAYMPVSMQTADADSLAAAQHALALNPDVALAYVAQGIVYTNQMHWAEADRVFRRALALAPGDAEAMDQYAQFLYAAGQLVPALAEIERALQRDPLSGVSGAVRAQLLFALHRNDEALKQIEGTLAAHPNGVLEHRIAVWVYLSSHRYPEAERQMRLSSPRHSDVSALLVRGIADPHLRASAVESLETSPALDNLRHDAIVHAVFLVALGQNERALAMLDEFALNGDSTTPQLLWYPAFDPIRDDPRFKAMLRKIDLPYAPWKSATP